MYKDIIFNNLVVEVTRRCNMSCLHCMRGNAENIDIDLKKLDKFLYQFKDKYVRFLFFTGGEPTLNLDAIKFTITKVIEYNITIAYVSLITNGKSISNEYIDFVNSCEFFMTYVSQDKYHDKLTDYDYSQLSKLKRVSALKDFLSDDSDVIKKGRAEYNNLRVSQTINSDFMFSRYNDNLLLLSKLLCTCNGDILTTCDYSFNDTDSVKFCNYDDDIIKLVIDKSVNYELKVLEHTSKGDKMYKFFEWLKKTGHEI